MDFDPNSTAPEGVGLFGLPYQVDDASLVIVPVPWDATSSQERNSSGAPDAIYSASRFVELYDPKLGAIYSKGIAMDAVNAKIAGLGVSAVNYQDRNSPSLTRVNRLCEQLNELVEDQVRIRLDSGHSVGLLGGDHSVSYGCIKAHLDNYPSLGILQVDAHCDLRCAFDGLTYSHASIMYNVMEKLGPEKLVQVGVRALCEFEADYLEGTDKVVTLFDTELHGFEADGISWRTVCSRIAELLPEEIYVSLDVDGLSPSACPNTGTPVPGGLTYNNLVFLLHYLSESGKKIVGFDLVEVGAEEYDASIAAHLLYQLCGLVR